MWRVIDYQEHSAFMNMAIDEAVSNHVRIGADPTIRFYGWKPSAVSIGYFQSLDDEVDLAACAENGIDIVRRRTGGGAVFHEHEITYSVIAPEKMFSKDIIESYRQICGWIIDSLSIVGIEAEFKPINDIVVGGKKISGNAQTRRQGVLLQHGTILYQVDVEKMFSLLKVPNEKIRDKMIETVKERVTSVRKQKNVSRDDLYHALLEGFTRGKEYRLGELSSREIGEASALVESRYLSREWNFWR